MAEVLRNNMKVFCKKCGREMEQKVELTTVAVFPFQEHEYFKRRYICPGCKPVNHIASFAFFLLAILFSINLVHAETDVQVVQQFQPGKIFAICEDNGKACSSTTKCNITLVYPNGTTFLENQQTVRENQVFTFNLTSGQTKVTGDHKLFAFCWDGAVNSPVPDAIVKVTPTGDERGFSLALILGIGATVMLVISLAIKNAYFGFIAGALYSVAGVYVRLFGFNNLNDIYTQTIGYVGIGLGMFLLIVSAYEWALED